MYHKFTGTSEANVGNKYSRNPGELWKLREEYDDITSELEQLTYDLNDDLAEKEISKI